MARENSDPLWRLRFEAHPEHLSPQSIRETGYFRLLGEIPIVLAVKTGENSGIDEDQHSNEDEANAYEKAEAAPIGPRFLHENH